MPQSAEADQKLLQELLKLQKQLMDLGTTASPKKGVVSNSNTSVQSLRTRKVTHMELCAFVPRTVVHLKIKEFIPLWVLLQHRADGAPVALKRINHFACLSK